MMKSTQLLSSMVVGLLSLVILGCSGPTADESSMPDASPVEAPAVASQPPADPASSEQGQAAAEVALADFAGVMESIQQHAGKVVVLDIWSRSCIPCMREFPHLVDLSQQHADEVVCLSLNVDYLGLKSKPAESYVPDVLEFLNQQRASTLVNFVSSEPDEIVFTKAEIDSIPAILVFDAAGELVHRFTEGNAGGDGLTYAEDVVPAIEKLLAE